MKLLLVSSSSGSRGGGELYLLYLGRALAERGHQVTLWASSHPRMDELAQGFAAFGGTIRAEYQNTYDQRGRSLSSYFNRRAAARIATAWQSAAFDALHLNKQNLEDGLDLLRAARCSGIPSLATIHLTQSARYLRAKAAAVRDLIARRALRTYPGLLVTVLENRRQDLADFLGNSPRIRVIPNGVPMFDLSEREAMRAQHRAGIGFKNDDSLFIAVGRMVPQKRPLLFLETAARVLRTMPHAAFLWVGDGALTGEWDAWVAAKGLGERIRRLPWHNNVPSLLLAADVFLHVAEFEGLPLAILEAMSAALPCAITTNLLAEMPFLNETNSIAIGSDETWIYRLRSPEDRTAIGTAARQLAEDRFSFARMATDYEALYAETLNAHP